MLREARAHAVPRPDFDQCAATVSSVLRRAALLARRSVDILLLGDDDLLGLTLAVSRARHRIVVVDADGTLLRVIRESAPEGTVDCVEHDLRNGLPRLLRNRFDEVFTDPPYTLAGQLLFAHRAVLALRRKGEAHLYLCASPEYLCPKQMEQVRCFLDRAGFERVVAYPSFNCYEAPPDVRRDLKLHGRRCMRWLRSDLLHYTRRRIAPIPRLDEALSGCIYEYS